jgi:hypothetical protein
MFIEKLEDLQFKIWDLFRKKYKVIQLARNSDDKDYLVAKFYAEWNANRYVDLISEKQKDYKIQDHYIVKCGKQVLLYK